MTARPAPVDAQCSWGVGPDPASGCDQYADGPDGLCGRHRTAVEALESTGHTIDVVIDGETGQWGWTCLICHAIYAAVLTHAAATASAKKHRLETIPRETRR